MSYVISVLNIDTFGNEIRLYVRLEDNKILYTDYISRADRFDELTAKKLMKNIPLKSALVNITTNGKRN